jgi:phosphatidylethanolamine/phosphatidyl-N-methylethanolamine N-methyltransferase
MYSALHASANGLPTTCDDLTPVDVVEFGPGTGQITAEISTDHLTLVEIDPQFCELLARRFPQAHVLQMSAVDFLKQQTTPVTVVSSIPLLNNPHSGSIKAAIAQGYERGIIRKLVTYSYGSKSPLGDCNFRQEQRFKRILRNVPPASVWIYS